MAVPVQRTWSVSDLQTAALFNANVRDAVNFILGGASGRKPTFQAYNTTAPSIATGTAVTIGCDTVIEDTDSAYNPSTGVYTAVTPGLYLFVGQVRWANSTSGIRQSRVMSTGSLTSSFGFSSPVFDQSGQSGTTLLTRLAAGQTVYLAGVQTSGSSLTIRGGADSTWLSGVYQSA